MDFLLLLLKSIRLLAGSRSQMYAVGKSLQRSGYEHVGFFKSHTSWKFFYDNLVCRSYRHNVSPNELNDKKN